MVKPVYLLLGTLLLSAPIALHAEDVPLQGVATGFSGGASDTTPDAFSFAPVADADPDTVVVAVPQITVSGLSEPVSITVSGSGTPAFRINGSGLVTSGTVSNGDIVEVSLHTAAGLFEETYTANLTIGTESANFSVTTRAADSSPDAFVFVDVNGAEVGATIAATPTISVSGLDVPVTATVTGSGSPGFTVNGGTATTSASVQNGDVLAVSLTTSAGSFEQPYAATLTVGDKSDTFNVVTRAADATPDAFSFTAASSVFPGSVATSNAVTLTGFEVPVSVSLSGDLGSEFSTDNGLTWTPIGTSGSAAAGASVLVRVQTGNTLNTLSTATLTAGGVSATFNATTASSFTCGSGAISALTLGQKSCSDSLYFVGTQSGERLYAKKISGTYAYKTALTTSGASSTTDGPANTSTLISASVTEHEAATACRLLGNEWYLPAIGELHVLTGNRSYGVLSEITTDQTGVFWSSTEYTSQGARNWDPTQTSTPLLWQAKSESSNVMCFRRDASPTTDRTASNLVFSPATISSADFSLAYSSDVVTLAGIDAVTPISITKSGPGTACYKVNGGTCQTGPSYVVNGNSVQVQVTTSAGLSETTTATLTVGDSSTTFGVTTASTTCVTKDLTTLAIGQSSCSVINSAERLTIYAGTMGGVRIYATPMSGSYALKTSSTGTSAFSTTDGTANTAVMTSTAANRTAHPAAAACWGLGTEWYLPAIDEVAAVRTNRTVGKLTLINPSLYTNVNGVAFAEIWSSTHMNNFNGRFHYWDSTAASSYVGKPEPLPIFCMRR